MSDDDSKAIVEALRVSLQDEPIPDALGCLAGVVMLAGCVILQALPWLLCIGFAWYLVKG